MECDLHMPDMFLCPLILTPRPNLRHITRNLNLCAVPNYLKISNDKIFNTYPKHYTGTKECLDKIFLRELDSNLVLVYFFIN